MRHWLAALAALVFAVGVSSAAELDGKVTTTWGALKSDSSGVQAAPGDQAIEARPVQGLAVGNGLRLWVHVFPAKGGPPSGGGPSPYCNDGNQYLTVPTFAAANPAGLTFNVAPTSIPVGVSSAGALQALHGSFDAWSATYFTVNETGGGPQPAADGNNTVGWVKIVPRSVLAATWTWADESGAVVEADIFFNVFYKWDAYLLCDASGKQDIGNVGTHEVGHSVGLGHLEDPEKLATMYPSAAAGEVRKRTLTDGDKAGYTVAGGF